MQLKLVYLGACNTGHGGAYADNLVTTIYSKGIDTVIGFKVEVNPSEAKLWTQYFMTRIASGYSIYNSMSYADAQVQLYFEPDSGQDYTTIVANRLVLGSTGTILCP